MIEHVTQAKGLGKRLTCRVLGFRRQTYYSRKQGRRPEELDAYIADLLHQITKRFLPWGFWMVFHYLRRQGHTWNHKRIYRIWKQEQLHLRQPVKRSRIKRKYLDLQAPDHINEGWGVDFVSDWIVGPNQEKVRIINIIDEHSRKALWTQAYSSISAKVLIGVLDLVLKWRGCPAYIRCDNGPEFISEQLKEWAQDKGITLRYIQPGKPSQNGIIERLNGTLRTECLNLEWFQNMEVLNEKIQEWSVVYNTLRPHSSIGYLTPDELEQAKPDLYFKAVA